MAMVNMLLSGGANVNIQDANGHTALYFAKIRKNDRLMARLIEGGADPTNLYRVEYPQLSALMAAIIENNVGVAEAIIESKYMGDVNQTDHVGWTTLMCASYIGSLELVHALLSKGANPNIQNDNGDTALMIASSKLVLHTNFIPVMNALIAGGANLNIQNINGITALMAAVEIGDVEYVRVLLRAGADVNLRDEDGDTAEMIAVRERHFDIVNLLRAPARNIAALNAAVGHRNERYEVGPAGESVGRIGNAGINYRREENRTMRRIPGNVMGLVGTFLSGKRGSVHEQATATRANAGPGPSAVLKRGAPSLKRRRRGRKTYKRR
jgi:ankyrin repeat protein